MITAVLCNFATGLKRLMHVDDAVDAGALHAAGGLVYVSFSPYQRLSSTATWHELTSPPFARSGAILTGIFADSRVTDFDGLTEIDGGWINGYFKVMGYQLAGVTSIVSCACSLFCDDLTFLRAADL